MWEQQNVKTIFFLVLIITFFSSVHESYAACGTDTVSRDGLTYGTVVGADGRCWLDRNLGATRVATAYNDAQAYGWLFQWGRGVDGHQISSSCTTTTKSTTNTPGHSCFIKVTSPYDWRNPYNNSLWQGSGGINNPCPAGFRLPTRTEWTTLLSAASITNYATAFNSSLKLATSGYRDMETAALGGQGSQEYYWSSTISGNTASYYAFIHSAAATTAVYSRGLGASVRCIKDPNAPILSTQTATSITATSAIGNGSITDVGGENPTRYIEWGTTSGTYTNSCDAGTGGIGAYSCAITGLTPETTYYVRAKATNSGGTTYGEEISFITSAFICGTTTISRDSILYGTVLGEDGKCWLDRNLGATRVATSSNDSASFGWYFQWGRGVDGHQISTSGTTTTRSSSDTPGHSNFVVVSTSPRDWRSPQNNELWQGMNGINNPCPTGFRVPTQSEWNALISSAGITNATTAFNSSLKLPLSGSRRENAAVNTGDGHYCSSTVSGIYALQFYFNASSSMIDGFADSRSQGIPMRCIKDVYVSGLSVVTGEITDITSSLATGLANITNIGADNPSRYIEYGTISGNYTNECIAGTGATGPYSCAITNLTPNTTYYYRAKATNAAGTSYGNELSFTTLPLDDTTITNPDPTKIQNKVTEGYMTIGTGTITNAAEVTTTVNVTIQDTIFNAIFPQFTQITGDGSFNFQNFTAQNVTQTVQSDQPTSRAAVKIGVPGEQLSFSQDITLTVNVGAAFNNQTLDILYQNDGESTWHTHGTCAVSNGQCAFTTDHATIYTINGIHQTTGDTPMNLNVQVQETLSMDCFDPSDSNTTVSLGTTTNPGLITAGTPAVGQSRCTVTTNADQGYYLTLTNNNPANTTLTHTDPHTGTVYEISELANVWNETTKTTSNWTTPTTKGLGFSIITFPETDTTHNQFDGVWNETNQCPEGTTADTNDYAGIPTTPQAISAVTSYQSSATTTNICYKVDVPASQPSGQYTGSVTFTATSDASGYWE